MKIKHLGAIIGSGQGGLRYANYTECGLPTTGVGPAIMVEEEEEGTCLSCAKTRVYHRKAKEQKREREEALQ